MMAAKSGHAEVVKLLLEADADTDIKTADGITALKWAKESGHSKIKEMLQKAGARE
jgi:ankyrin repeat protein